jgi:AraC-like DNA-binding protein
VFHDPDEVEAFARGAGSVLKSTLLTAGSYRLEMTETRLATLRVRRSSLSLPRLTYYAFPAAWTALTFDLDAHQAPSMINGEETSAATVTVAPAESASFSRTLAGLVSGSVFLSPEKLTESARALLGCELPGPPTCRLIRPHPDKLQRLRQLHKAARECAASTPDILAVPSVARGFEEEFYRAVVGCLADDDPAARGGARDRAAIMRRFERVLEGHEGESIFVTGLCAEIGVSERVLRRHCQEHLGMGPQHYLWLRRMNMARRALALADGEKATVTTIASDHGFGELGRFAVQYRKLFGESPSVTLRRLPDEPRPAALRPPEGIQFPILP